MHSNLSLYFKKLPGLITIAWTLFACSNPLRSQPLRVAVAGLSHDHVLGLFSQYKSGNVFIIGIAEKDKKLVERYKGKYLLPDSLFYPDVETMLHQVKPEVVLAYNAISEHLAVVEACAPKGIPVMVEKPLATTSKQAERIAELAQRYHVQVLTNYETTWYGTFQQIPELVKNAQEVGPIGKMIVHMGHQGPVEIGCSSDFLAFLTDSVKNGGGAIMDFGCYGANLMIWLMNGAAPISVTAITRHLKPQIYPMVDDDATILLEYPNATGIIEASWNWPFGIKDLEVFGQNGYVHALNAAQMLQRKGNEYNSLSVHAPPFKDNLSYLAEILRGKPISENDLSGLKNNLIVVKILDAARISAKEGRKVFL